jgi:hypothetical protein
MQSRFDVSNWHGLTLGAAYTWSRTLDNASEIFSTFSGGNTVAAAQNPFDVSVAERGVSGISYPHILTVYWNYELPWYKSQQGVLGHFLGGWSVNSTYRYTSGQVYTPAQFLGTNSSCQNSFDGTFFGASTCRPILSNPLAALDAVGFCTDSALADCGITNNDTGAPTTLDAVRWIINDDVASDFLGTPFGGVGRNTERGEPINAVNLSVFKTTNITERVKIRFEAQAFNLLNRQFRGIPDPFVQDGNFADSNSSFGNTFFNDSGGDSTNPTLSGIGRRRLIFGLKVIF